MIDFRGVEQAVGDAEAKCVCANDKHPVPGAQALGDDIDDLRLAAMTVEEDEFAQPGGGNAAPHLAPGRNERFRIVAEGSGKTRMFEAEADDRLAQDENIEIVPRQFQSAGGDSAADAGVGGEGKVRAVLWVVNFRFSQCR